MALSLHPSLQGVAKTAVESQSLKAVGGPWHLPAQLVERSSPQTEQPLSSVNPKGKSQNKRRRQKTGEGALVLQVDIRIPKQAVQKPQSALFGGLLGSTGAHKSTSVGPFSSISRLEAKVRGHR